MIAEKMEIYQSQVAAPGKRAARARITRDAQNAVRAAVHGDLSPNTALFKTAVAAHNAIEAKKGMGEAFFVDALTGDDRHSFKNAGPRHVVLVSFPPSYDGDPVQDAKTHGYVRSDGSVDLTGWAIKNGGSAFKKGPDGKTEQLEIYL
jgi:hypothetical protein